MEKLSITLTSGSKLKKPITLKFNSIYEIRVTTAAGTIPPDGNGWWLPFEVVGGADNALPDQHFISMVEIEDTLFRHRSSVFLPSIIDFSKQSGDSGTQQQCASEGITVIYSVLKHLRAYQSYTIPMILAGHTDTTGDKEYNRKLSAMRSNTAAWVLMGDIDSRALWVAQFKDYYVNGIQTKTDEDLQHILKWTASKRGWACDPGEIDGVIGSNTTAAIKAFQIAYNLDPEFSSDIKENGIADGLTWGAFYDVYQVELAKLFGVSAADLNSIYRAGIDWKAQLKTTACGENWPVDSASKDNYRSQTNRRVEMLLFNPETTLTDYEPYVPCLAGTCSKSSCKLFDPEYFCKARMTPFDSGVGPVENTWLLLYDENGNAMENVEWKVDNDGDISEGVSIDGWIELPQPIQCPSICNVYWGDKDASGRFEYHCQMDRYCNEDGLSDNDEARAKLNNMGYPSALSFEVQVCHFQKDKKLTDWGLASDGSVPPGTLQKIRESYSLLLGTHE
jgi:outer membrane protein OmpA-like peptidoglycan-associated protein